MSTVQQQTVQEPQTKKQPFEIFMDAIVRNNIFLVKEIVKNRDFGHWGSRYTIDKGLEMSVKNCNIELVKFFVGETGFLDSVPKELFAIGNDKDSLYDIVDILVENGVPVKDMMKAYYSNPDGERAGLGLDSIIWACCRNGLLSRSRKAKILIDNCQEQDVDYIYNGCVGNQGFNEEDFEDLVDITYCKKR